MGSPCCESDGDFVNPPLSRIALEMVRGKSASWTIAIMTVDSSGKSVAADITLSTPTFICRANQFSTTILFTKTVGAGITVITTNPGVLRLDLVPADTAFPSPAYPNSLLQALWVELDLAFPGSLSYTPAAGWLRFSQLSPGPTS